MPRLSVVLIVKNEAHRLLNCLDSVREIADEVVVADTGSTDETKSVAREWGATVEEVPWTDDFAAARNAAMRFASGEWILQVDADEVLDEQSAQSIRHLVDQDAFGADAVEVMLANYCDDPRAWRWVPAENTAPIPHEYSGYIPIPLLRLFRNGKGIEYREPIHENITSSLADVGGSVLPRHDIHIHHYGYRTDVSGREPKAVLYLRIARMKREQSPLDIKALHDLAEQALACGETAEAEQACRDAIVLNPQHIPSVMTLANICLNRGDVKEGRELLAGIEGHPEAPSHVIIGLSVLEYREGRLLQAMNRLERLLQQDPKALLGRLYLARIYDRFNAHDRALRQLELARDAAPTVKEFENRVEAIKQRRGAFDYFQEGHTMQALETLVSAMRLDPEDPLIHNDMGVILFGLGERDKARTSFQRALQLAPGMAEADENLRKLG